MSTALTQIADAAASSAGRAVSERLHPWHLALVIVSGMYLLAGFYFVSQISDMMKERAKADLIIISAIMKSCSNFKADLENMQNLDKLSQLRRGNQ